MDKFGRWNFILSSGKSPPALPTSPHPSPPRYLPVMLLPLKPLKVDLGFGSWQISSLVLGHTERGTEAPRWREGGIRQVQADPLFFQFPQWLPLTRQNWWWGEGPLLLGANAAREHWDSVILFVACKCEKERRQIKVTTRWRGCLRMSNTHSAKTLKTSSWMPSLERLAKRTQTNLSAGAMQSSKMQFVVFCPLQTDMHREKQKIAFAVVSHEEKRFLHPFQRCAF